MKFKKGDIVRMKISFNEGNLVWCNNQGLSFIDKAIVIDHSNQNPVIQFQNGFTSAWHSDFLDLVETAKKVCGHKRTKIFMDV